MSNRNDLVKLLSRIFYSELLQLIKLRDVQKHRTNVSSHKSKQPEFGRVSDDNAALSRRLKATDYMYQHAIHRGRKGGRGPGPPGKIAGPP